MAKRKTLENYPSKWLDLVRRVGAEQRPILIPNIEYHTAFKLRWEFYGFRRALLDANHELAPLSQAMFGKLERMDGQQPAKKREEEPPGLWRLTFNNRDNTAQALLLSECLAVDEAEKGPHAETEVA